MAALHSIHVGVNAVDPAHYGTDAPLRGCENDARDMQSIAAAMGYQTQIFLTRDATAGRLLEAVAALRRKLNAGDTMLLTLACHGAQLPDTTGDEEDGRDETWCLYDRMIIDDEVYAAFSGFRPGVRIFVLSDSCHSGTSVRMLLAAKTSGDLETLNLSPQIYFRCIEPFLDRSVFDAHLPEYRRIKASVQAGARERSGPDVALISGCQDNQTSGDLPTNGLFTSHLKKVWNNGRFTGDYRAFRKHISDSMNTPTQVPNLFFYGPTVNRLLDERPFGPAKTARPAGKPKKRQDSPAKQNGAGDTEMYESGLHPSVVNIMRNGGARPTPRYAPDLGAMERVFEGGCVVRIDRALLEGKSDSEVLKFFTDVVGPEMCSNYFVARDAFSGAPVPRGGEISCTASTSGGGSVSCTGTWRF